MKFILFDISDNKQHIVRDLYINDSKKTKIREIVFSRNFLKKLTYDKKGIFKRFKFNYLNKKFIKIIKKGLENNKFKWYYFLSTNFNNEEKKFLKIKLQSLLGYEYIIESEMNKNLEKYIDDYSKANNKKENEIKILLVYNQNRNINLLLIKSLIEKYKFVSIYLKEKPSNYILKQINNINNSYGSTIDFVKNEKKSLKEFDIVYFVNLRRDDFSKFRLNKKTLVIDEKTELDDRYNSNIIYLDDFLKANTEQETTQNLIKKYGKLEASNIIKNLN